MAHPPRRVGHFAFAMINHADIRRSRTTKR